MRIKTNKIKDPKRRYFTICHARVVKCLMNSEFSKSLKITSWTITRNIKWQVSTQSMCCELLSAPSISNFSSISVKLTELNHFYFLLAEVDQLWQSYWIGLNPKVILVVDVHPVVMWESVQQLDARIITQKTMFISQLKLFYSLI